MDEKEYLEKFVEFLDRENYDICLGSLMIKSITMFLEEHHKTYSPTWFFPIVGRDKVYGSMIRQQAKFKMKSFFEFAGLEFTEEIGQKLEAYWDENLNTV